MQFRKVVRDIKNLKIQGAEHVAIAGVKALSYVLHKSRAHTAKELLKELHSAQKELVGARPTEPCLRNALNYVLIKCNNMDISSMIKELGRRSRFVQKYFIEANKSIASTGVKKLPKHAVVFTICHSTAVMTVLAKAKFSGKKFEVHNTETRPMFQGRITAKELSALGVKVHHYVDSAARLALKNTDIFLFGADAIQSDGRIINKIGTELFLEIAEQYDIPCYCCTPTWKFDPSTIYGPNEPIENRTYKEIWSRPPKDVTVMNPAFEIVEPKLVTGVISEIGVYRPEVFVDEVRRTSPWMF